MALVNTVSTPSATANAAVPVITDSSFIGYRSSGSTWSAYFCPQSSAWYQTSTWGRCCPTTTTNAACGIWTACVSTSIIISRGGANATCSSPDPVCRTATISKDQNDQNPFIYVGCGTADWTAFRTPPAAVIKTLTEIKTQAEGDEIPTSTLPRTATNTNPATSPTGAAGGGSSSKAWIAGAVIGPIAFAIIAGLIFYIWKLKKSPKEDPSAQPMMASQPAYAQGQAYYPPEGQQQYEYPPSGEYYGSAAKPYYSEHQYAAGGQVAPVELGGDTYRDHVPAPVEAPVEAPTEAPGIATSPKPSGAAGAAK